ncbi:MAG: hypothetical protein ACW98Y_16800 [Candidatus Thorarchaeota archaeon]
MPSMRGSIGNRLAGVTHNGGQVIGFQPDAVSQRLIITLMPRVNALRASSERLVVQAAEDDGKHNTYT